MLNLYGIRDIIYKRSARLDTVEMDSIHLHPKLSPDELEENTQHRYQSAETEVAEYVLSYIRRADSGRRM